MAIESPDIIHNNNQRSTMRMKISILDSTDRNINIQNVLLRDGDTPKIYFDCHKKHELIFYYGTLVFHDSKGKEFFRAKLSRADYRYYEDDSYYRSPKRNKVKVFASGIYVEGYGPASVEYIEKVLGNVCNSKISRLNRRMKRAKIPVDTGMPIELQKKYRAERVALGIFYKKSMKLILLKLLKPYYYKIKLIVARYPRFMGVDYLFPLRHSISRINIPHYGVPP